MANIDYELKGLPEIQKLLAQLPADINKSILTDVMLKTGGIVKKEIVGRIPEGNNNKRSGNKLTTKVKVVKSETGGALIGFKKSGFYARFLEFGTKVRKTLGRGRYKAGANRGSMTSKPFLQSAHESATPKAVSFFSENFAKLINNAIKKQIKKVK